MRSDKLKNINDNPLSRKWKARYNSQPESVKKELQRFKEMNSKEYQLNVIKRSRTNPITGDIFLLKPRTNRYFIGKVLVGNIEAVGNNGFTNNKILIAIYGGYSEDMERKSFNINPSKLLIPPQIVDRSYWTRGYFFNITNEELSDDDINMDIGFYDIGKSRYVSAEGNLLLEEPSVLGTYGLATITGIASQIGKEIIMDPSIVK